MISDLQIEKAMERYGVSVPPGAFSSIRTYISMLLRWNARISLTTVVEPLEILKFHFGESICAIKCVPIEFGRLADVGSGAGFPGLPLAMVVSDLKVVLIESSVKKATFLSEVIRELKINNATVWRGRAEEMPSGGQSFDFVAARALGHHKELLDWSKDRLTSAGKIVLWLGDEDAGTISGISGWRWGNPARIPDSERRVILFGSSEFYDRR